MPHRSPKGQPIAAPVVVRPGTTRAASIGALPAVLDRLGVPLQPLLDCAGLPHTLFDHPDDLVEIGQAARLLNLAAERADCPHVGLLCGQAHSPDTIGIAGRLARNAKDVGSALRGLALNLHLNGHAFVPTLIVTDQMAEFGLRLAADIPGSTRATVDLGMAAAFSITRSLCGPDWAATDILLVHAPGGDRKLYDRYYRVPVRFGSDRNALLFPSTWLKRPVHGANAAQRHLLERELAMAAARNQLPPDVATRRILLAYIARGELSMRTVAIASGLHPRTLNRRLARQGASVFSLMQEVRYQIARDLLANSALAITEIAATLVYADMSAFTRAFRKWSGMSPRKWRQEHTARAARQSEQARR